MWCDRTGLTVYPAVASGECQLKPPIGRQTEPGSMASSLSASSRCCLRWRGYRFARSRWENRGWNRARGSTTPTTQKAREVREFLTGADGSILFEAVCWIRRQGVSHPLVAAGRPWAGGSVPDRASVCGCRFRRAPDARRVAATAALFVAMSAVAAAHVADRWPPRGSAATDHCGVRIACILQHFKAGRY